MLESRCVQKGGACRYGPPGIHCVSKLVNNLPWICC